MARMLSPLASILRGSIAGLTFLSNQYHQIVVRQKTAPVNPKTTNQEIMRIAFANASTAWRSLTDGQRKDWEDYAKSVVYPGPLGDYSPTGRNIFMANLGLVYYINSRALDVIVVSLAAPLVDGVPSWAAISIAAPTVPGTGFSVHLGNTCGFAMNYFITHSIPFDPTRNRWKGPWDSESAVSDEVADQAVADVDFLNLTLDRVYFVRVRGVTVEGGHRSSFEVILRAVAETTLI